MKIYVVIDAVVFVSACQPPPPNACQQAANYGEMFGTPENKGPCWGRTISTSPLGNISSYMFEMSLPFFAIGTATYDGDTLVQAGVTR